MPMSAGQTVMLSDGKAAINSSGQKLIYNSSDEASCCTVLVRKCEDDTVMGYTSAANAGKIWKIGSDCVYAAEKSCPSGSETNPSGTEYPTCVECSNAPVLVRKCEDDTVMGYTSAANAGKIWKIGSDCVYAAERSYPSGSETNPSGTEYPTCVECSNGPPPCACDGSEASSYTMTWTGTFTTSGSPFAIQVCSPGSDESSITLSETTTCNWTFEALAGNNHYLDGIRIRDIVCVLQTSTPCLWYIDITFVNENIQACGGSGPGLSGAFAFRYQKTIGNTPAGTYTLTTINTANGALSAPATITLS